MTLQEQMARHSHLAQHVQQHQQEAGATPEYADVPTAGDPSEPIDIIYPIQENVFVHVAPHDANDGKGPVLRYRVIEPILDDALQQRLERMKEKIYRRAIDAPPPTDGLESAVHVILGKLLPPGDPHAATLTYYIIRDIARHGPLEPLLQDDNLEDVQGIGAHPVHVIHRFYGMLPTDVKFQNNDEASKYVRNLSERVGRPASDANPIVDATLGDGSRLNLVYADDVSPRGPSFSIRRVHEHPISITQLIQWGTLSSEVAAYLWLCLENGMSIFVCGESACGKSATLNALLPFIDLRTKIYTAEDTPEVRPPHPLWQRLLTYDGTGGGAKVEMFDLLRAALRSRPDYIIVGEIRGAEGRVAFQAMQTGHPTVATFHAPDRVKLIQRLTSQPIDIPNTFLDNLNVVVFQRAIKRQGRLMRRVTAVDEIQGYSELDGGVVTLPAFARNDDRDRAVFTAKNSSYILEQRIARQRGYSDTRVIYDEMARRARILDTMIQHGILHSEEVNKIFVQYTLRGEDALPFEVD